MLGLQRITPQNGSAHNFCSVRAEFSVSGVACYFMTFGSSCDLDEWTSDQLEIMKISGNGNAKSYFKKHGVTDEQMMV